MKASELRIGNLVNFCGYYFSAQNDIDFKELYRNLNMVSGIPLTPEILEMAGFVIVGCGTKHWYAFSEGSHHFRFYPPSRVWYKDLPIECQHLHQLQNLYFALTGQELTIDLNH